MNESESAIHARLSRHQVAPSDFDLVALAGRGAFGKVIADFRQATTHSILTHSIYHSLGLGSAQKK